MFNSFLYVLQSTTVMIPPYISSFPISVIVTIKRENYHLGSIRRNSSTVTQFWVSFTPSFDLSPLTTSVSFVGHVLGTPSSHGPNVLKVTPDTPTSPYLFSLSSPRVSVVSRSRRPGASGSILKNENDTHSTVLLNLRPVAHLSRFS